MDEERSVDEERSAIQHVLVLRRVEPEQNVARFYALMIECDLFGQRVLMCCCRSRACSRLNCL